MDRKRGQGRERSSKGLRAKCFARSILKRTARELVQTRTLTSIFTPWIAAVTVLTRATHSKLQQIVSMRIFYCIPYRPNIRQFDKPTWREETCRYPAYDGGHLRMDHLACSRFDSFRGIAGRGAAMQAMIRDRNDIQCHFCGSVGHFKIKCPLYVKQQQENDGQQPQQREEQQNNPRRQRRRSRGSGGDPVWCSYHATNTHSDADCRTRR